MSGRAAAVCVAALALAGALAWFGYELLSLPNGGNALAEKVVGADGARRTDEALALFRASVSERVTTNAAFARRVRAEAALAGVGGDAHVRAQAQTLLGVLTLEDALAQRRRTGALVAAAAFRNAVLLDPTDEQAAFDLELLLAKTHASGNGGSGGAGRTRKRAQSAHGGHNHAGGPGGASKSGGGY